MTGFLQPIYVAGFLISFSTVLLLVPLVRRFASRRGILDRPDETRKIQAEPVPLLGGWAVFGGFAFSAAILTVWYGGGWGEFIHVRYLAGVVCGGLLLMIGGYLDRKSTR